MSRALGETVIQDALGNVITGCTIDLLDPSTGLRVTVPVYADATSATTLTLPFVSPDGKVSFYLAMGQLVTVQATKSGVTATELVAASDPTGSTTAPHSHIEGDVTGLVSDLGGKSVVGHTHNLRRVIGVPLVNPSGSFPLIIPLFRTDHAITVVDVWGYRLAGTGATLNVRKVSSGTPTNLLPSDLSLVSTSAWLQGTLSVVAGVTTLAGGDSLEAMFQSETGTPTQSNLSITVLDVTS